MKNPAAKLKKLNERLDKARMKYEAALGELLWELEQVSGIEVDYNDFPGDGLGIGVKGCKCYMPFDHLLLVIEEKGTFEATDIVTSL